jgi:Helix-turn-helix domain
MTQKELIKQYLLSGQMLSPIEALQKYSCFRLGARIYDLRKEGYEIENIGADDRNYAVYRLRPSRPIVLPPAFKETPHEATQPLL